MTKFIAITGPRQCGKSTTANLMKQVLLQKGYTAVVYPFATPVYKLAAAFTGLSTEEMESNEFKTNVHASSGLTGREILNNVAKGLQAVNPACMSVWWVDNAPCDVDYFIVPDVRTEVEMGIMELNESTIVHLNMPGVDYTRGDFDSPLELKDHHYLLGNDSTLPRLLHAVKLLINIMTVESHDFTNYRRKENHSND